MKQLYFLFCLFLCTFVACKDDTKRQQLIDQEVKNAIESFRQKKFNECRTALLDSANKLADSIILVRNTVVDTALINGKPKKPTKPVIKSPLDTTPVEPLFKK
ncbi:MAG: hypothetical protein JNL70_20400 [Saprospiraceae bacterium]|nr:hypothetical protein [Saprospiraceae bacterium]